MTKEEKTAIEGLIEEIRTLHKDMLILNKRVNYILTQVQLGNAIQIEKDSLGGITDDAANFYMDMEERFEKALKQRATEKFKAVSKAEKEKEENNNEKSDESFTKIVSGIVSENSIENLKIQSVVDWSFRHGYNKGWTKGYFSGLFVTGSLLARTSRFGENCESSDKKSSEDEDDVDGDTEARNEEVDC